MDEINRNRLEEFRQEGRAWLQGSDSESIDCPIFSGDGSNKSFRVRS